MCECLCGCAGVGMREGESACMRVCVYLRVCYIYNVIHIYININKVGYCENTFSYTCLPYTTNLFNLELTLFNRIFNFPVFLRSYIEKAIYIVLYYLIYKYAHAHDACMCIYFRRKNSYHKHTQIHKAHTHTYIYICVCVCFVYLCMFVV